MEHSPRRRSSFISQISDVDIRLMHIFRTIVSCGGISAAELALNIGRSTISRHLTDLEIRLGMKLCHRGPAGFALTPEGERVFDSSNTLQAAIENFKSELNDVHEQLVGTLSIGLFDKTITNSAAHIATTFQQFDRIATKSTLHVVVKAINEMESSLLSGQLQIGIMPVHRRSSSLKYIPIYKERMLLYCGKGNVLFKKRRKDITSKDVRAAKYAGLGYQSPNMIVSNQQRLQRDAESNSQEALALLILSGCYTGFLPDHFARRYVQEGEMKAIRPDLYSYESEFSAVVRRYPEPSRLAEAFLECLLECHGIDKT